MTPESVPSTWSAFPMAAIFLVQAYLTDEGRVLSTGVSPPPQSPLLICIPNLPIFLFVDRTLEGCV